jgi:hypothetical protein
MIRKYTFRSKVMHSFLARPHKLPSSAPELNDRCTSGSESLLNIDGINDTFEGSTATGFLNDILLGAAEKEKKR